jgi:hypothetical protein
MEMPPDILTELLAGRHFNMQERKDLGLLPHEVLRYDEVRDHLAAVVSEREWFPRQYVPHVPGEPVDERLVVQRLGPRRYVCHAERAQAIAPTVLAEESHGRFTSASRAADYFLRWEHALPGDLDGWKVV